MGSDQHATVPNPRGVRVTTWILRLAVCLMSTLIGSAIVGSMAALYGEQVIVHFVLHFGFCKKPGSAGQESKLACNIL